LKSFTNSKKGQLKVYLRDVGGSSSTTIATTTFTDNPWGAGSTWLAKTIEFTGVSYTVPAGRALELKVTVHSGSGDDMWVAYDTVLYPSSLTLP
jgi:hypothetical protein